MPKYFVQRGQFSDVRHYGTDVEMVPASDYDALAARLAECEKFLEPTGWQKAQDEHNALRARLAEAEALLLKWLDGSKIDAWDASDAWQEVSAFLAADSASGEGEK